MSLARNFRFARDGRVTLQFRAEFSNIFNRTVLPNPTSANALQAQIPGASGFGFINTRAPGTSRQGTLVGRFRF